jgi:hypothetical protein
LTNAGVLPSVRENLSVLTSRAAFMASTPFFGEPGKQHPDGNMDRFDIFNIGETGSPTPV